MSGLQELTLYDLDILYQQISCKIKTEVVFYYFLFKNASFSKLLIIILILLCPHFTKWSLGYIGFMQIVLSYCSFPVMSQYQIPVNNCSLNWQVLMTLGNALASMYETLYWPSVGPRKIVKYAFHYQMFA